MKPVRNLLLAASLAVSTALTALPASTAAGAGQPPPADEPLFESVDIATSGVGADTYRIPALEKLPDGTLIAAYDRRNDDASDLPGDIDVLVERSYDNGRTWTEPQVIAGANTEVGSGDPSIIVDDQTGRIFVFYATGAGFFQSGQGNDEDDPSLIHTDYSYSDDGGDTWTKRRITKEIKDPDWYGIFAASGTGIQLKHGPHKGRLIQQYTMNLGTGLETIHAASAYSDDHGQTWHMGDTAGPSANENKTVQLADGRVMMNSRTTAHNTRLIGYSDDGGESYGNLTPDDELVDPGNNAAIIRYDEDARANRPRSHWLLFSNTADPNARRNLTIKMSCNDGKTWPIAKTVEPGPAAYSTMVELGDDTYGLLYESGPYDKIVFARFNAAWLGADCPTNQGHPKLGTSLDTAEVVEAGETVDIDLTVTNHGHRSSIPGSVTLDVPDGWSVSPAQQEVPALESGESAAATFSVTAADDAEVGEHELVSHIHAGASAITGTHSVQVMAAPSGDVWASDLAWISATNGWGPVERDTANGERAAGDGPPLTLNGSVYDKGLGTHAPSRVRYFVGGNCQTFTADVGLDDYQATRGSVTFTVLADGAVVADSPVMRPETPTHELSADISGAEYVDLVVGDAGDGVGNDHADWAAARFHCAS